MSWYYGWAPRPTAADRKRKAAKQIAALEKKGKILSPVVLAGTKIASTFWGKAWCQNLESYSDYANRLPRGRSYVRSGSVLDLQINPSKVTALVQGTRLYDVSIAIGSVDAPRWKAIVGACSGQIDSVVELLQGKLSKAVMEVISSKETGLFPAPRQIKLSCSCPDSASMCKHVAAVLYGVGARLDEQPDLLFRLRGADPTELIASAATGAVLGGRAPAKEKRLAADLSSVFGIDLDPGPTPAPEKAAPAPKKAVTPKKAVAAPKKVTAKKAVAKPHRAVAAPKKTRASDKAIPAPRTIKGPELRALGVSPGTVQYWLKTGILRRTDTPGVYEETEATREQLARRGVLSPA